MSESNIFSSIVTSNPIENSSVYSKEIINSLKALVKKLEETRNKIRGKKLEDMTQDDFNILTKEFEKEIEEYDKLKVDNDFTEDELEELSKDRYRVIYLDKCLSIQTLISRIAHKINNHKNNVLLKEYEDKLKFFENTIEAYAEMEIELNNLKNNYTETSNNYKEIKNSYEEIKNSLPEVKESILTITSLLLTIFSIIQINFIAFEKSSDYTILDRLILFSGINVFLLMAITTIFFIIKSIIEKKNKYYGFVGLFILIFISLFCYLSFNYDSFTRKINNKNINNISQENITNIENKIKTIDEILQKNINNLKQDTQMDIKNLKQDIQYIKEDIRYIKKDIKEINYEKREE